MPSPEMKIGDVLDGRYELRRELGHGAAGRVFEAAHRFTGRSVAIKLLAGDVPVKMREELRARLLREARALASVRHPGVVEVLDGGFLPDETPFLVMEMLDGRTLEGLLTARGRLPVGDTVALGLALCDALDAAHAAGIVHRDVKPSNILVVQDYSRRELIKLVDFGIARLEASKEEKLTGIGALIGTPGYMAPEQLLALEDVDNRSDIYALGVTLFECLTGRMPYEGNYQRVLLQVCSNEPVPTVASAVPDVPAALSAVIARAMSKERADRYGWMKDLGKALREAYPAVAPQTYFLGPPPAAAPAAPNPAFKRKLPRAPYVTPVRLVVGNLTIDGRTEDISIGGVLLICHQVCAANAKGSLRFALPIEGNVVQVDVEVRWSRAARADDPDGPRALGIEFVDPPKNVLTSIGQYVSLMGPEGARG